jgi:maleylacetoacetate isomerase
MSPLILYTYFRSSAAYRVRIALNLKGLGYESRAVHLLRDGGEHLAPAYRAVNPMAVVPTLVDERGPLTQSLAIIEYLNERYPEPPLLPEDPHARAEVRAMAQLVACDIHPLNNLRVLRYLKDELGVAQDGADAWYRHWMAEGLAALETLVSRKPEGPFCRGDRPSMADICLVPQLANARRYACDLAPYARLVAIDEHCRALPAFAAAAPERQPDAESPK